MMRGGVGKPFRLSASQKQGTARGINERWEGGGEGGGRKRENVWKEGVKVATSSREGAREYRRY